MTDQLSRRRLLADSALAAAAGAAVGQGFVEIAEAAGQESSFRSDWHNALDRVWLGPQYWANPLQDWQVAGGRAECVNAALNRHVHLLTRELAEREGTLEMSVRIGRVDGGVLGDGPGSAGFRISIQGPLKEYRNSLIFGQGLNAGFSGSGALFIGDDVPAANHSRPFNVKAIVLRFTCRRTVDGYIGMLEALNAATGASLGSTSRPVSESLAGTLALIANYGTPAGPRSQRAANDAAPKFGADKFWFADWKIAGTKVVAHDDRGFGPILFTQYTLSHGVLKLTAQMPPLGANDSQSVRLEIDRGDGWKKLAEAQIHPQARTATFRVEKWDASQDVPYRVVYDLKTKDRASHYHTWTGTIRRDPSINRCSPWPMSRATSTRPSRIISTYGTCKLDPDLLAFTGDQFYESTGGYGVTVSPLEPAILDYLRKWYMHGWTWRELTRDRPSVSIPDDHDVYQGNIWGEGGAPQQRTQEAGGYRMPAAWVNVVHRTQTSHHPDPCDSTPVKQGITRTTDR